jgi:hypothetical protein
VREVIMTKELPTARRTARAVLLAAAIATTSLGGCYKATIHLADAPAAVSTRGYGFHFSLIGLIELSPAVDLRARCPGGVSAIEERETLLGALVNAVLGTYIPVLQVMNDRVDCSAGGAPPGTTAPMGTGAGY